VPNIPNCAPPFEQLSPSMKGSIFFGDAKLGVSWKFTLPPPVKSGKITNPPDLDNLVKFDHGMLEQGNYVDNDAQVACFNKVKKLHDDSCCDRGYVVMDVGRSILKRLFIFPTVAIS
jgi:hypothetical protein